MACLAAVALWYELCVSPWLSVYRRYYRAVAGSGQTSLVSLQAMLFYMLAVHCPTCATAAVFVNSPGAYTRSVKQGLPLPLLPQFAHRDGPRQFHCGPFHNILEDERAGNGTGSGARGWQLPGEAGHVSRCLAGGGGYCCKGAVPLKTNRRGILLSKSPASPPSTGGNPRVEMII